VVAYADTFDRSDSAAGSGLGSTSTGARLWQVVQGAWRILSNRAVPSAASPVPIAVLELPGGDADASIVGSGGAALYGRVVDANNWVRTRVAYETQTTTTPYTYYTYTYTYSATVTNPSGTGSISGATCSTSSPSGCTSGGEYGYSGYSVSNRQQTGSSSQENTGYSTSTSYSYVAVLEVCVNGVVTEVARTSAASSMSRLRMKLAGASAQIYYGGATTVATLPPAAVSALASANRHGIGLGPSPVQESYVDDYQVEVLNTAPGSPTSTAPAAGATVASGQVIRHSWEYTDPDANDAQKSFELQYRVAGTTNWTTVTEATANKFWDAPAGLLSGSIEWRVRVSDTAGATSPYSATTPYSISSGSPGGGGSPTAGGGGGTGITPLGLITLVQLSDMRVQLDALTEMVMEAQ